MQIWTCTGGANQKWVLKTGPGSGATTPPPITGHTIKPSASSTTCLTAPTNANGAKVVVQSCVNGATSQSWTHNGQTIVVYGNMCLDVTDGSTANGVKMQIWSCTPGAGDSAQHFSVTSDKRIQWAGRNECLDLTSGSLTSGNPVQMWACAAGNTNQVWNII
ncbi:carbohydrate-binding module family 13 protein [Mycena albidolilacea]|uniref:Carbohydrate-binding module family 13 protein n=1 Tax=Mycena albidolilacea TaxID=1033008 RepID=A0AAD7A627_9AGAR|nr:carbohydrate-binding module family 13 protein [Mycena albidolilacea]